MTEKITGAEAIIRSLIAEGVETIFGYPGGAIIPVYDALYDYQDKIQHILTRHEQGAIHAAQGYARVKNQTGVVMVTSGPGATNIITGVADAMMDSTPLVCITGQVFSSLLGTDAFQEADVIGLTSPITKWNCQITQAEDIPRVIAEAFHIANTGRKGPVVIDITKDAQINSLDFEYKKCDFIRSYQPDHATVEDAKLIEAAGAINKARKPFALIGQGAILSGAETELRALLEKADIPMAWTLLGASAMPTDHPLNMGMLGMHGNFSPNLLTNESDVILAIGMRFDDRVTGKVSEYLPNAKIIHIEIDPAEVDKIMHISLPLNGDIKEILTRLLPHIQKTKRKEWHRHFEEAHLKEDKVVYEIDLRSETGGLRMAEVIRKVSEKLSHDAVMVTDVGQHQMMAARYFKFSQSLSMVTSGGLGTMGFGLPASVGAKFGQPDRPVVLFVGDGGFQMTLQELATIRNNNLEVKIVILNNRYLGMVRQWQQLFHDKRYSFTDMSDNPDFVGIAKAYKIESMKVEKREDLPGAIEKMVTHKGPFLLEAIVEREDNVFPMVPAGAAVKDIILQPENS